MRATGLRLALVTTSLFFCAVLVVSCQSPAIPKPGDAPTALTTQEPRTDADAVPAPDLRLVSLAGETIALSALQGRWVVVNFWATWCEPCVSEMPFLDALPALFPDDLVVLAINLRESPQEVGDFAREHGLRLPVLLAPDDETILAYQVTSLPLTVVVSPKGEIVRRFPGMLEPDEFEKWLRGVILASDGRTSGP